jgi:hypothetical protein
MAEWPGEFRRFNVKELAALNYVAALGFSFDFNTTWKPGHENRSNFFAGFAG